MKSRLVFLTLTLVLVIGNPLYAMEPRPDAGPVKVLRAALSLTEVQVTEIRALLQVRAEAVEATSAEIKALQAQLEEILQSDAPDPCQFFRTIDSDK